MSSSATTEGDAVPREPPAAAPPSRRHLPGWVRPLILPVALAAVAALYLSLVQHAPLTGGVVILVLGAAVLGVLAHHVVGAADALVRGADEEAARSAIGRRRRDLLLEKAAILKALKELEFDHAMEKIADADFEDLDERLRTRARRVLRALDQSGGSYRGAIEEELKRRRAERERKQEASR